MSSAEVNPWLILGAKGLEYCLYLGGFFLTLKIILSIIQPKKEDVEKKFVKILFIILAINSIAVMLFFSLPVIKDSFNFFLHDKKYLKTTNCKVKSISKPVYLPISYSNGILTTINIFKNKRIYCENKLTIKDLSYFTHFEYQKGHTYIITYLPSTRFMVKIKKIKHSQK
ncbi:hypothetical protein [Desulfonauticus submarinus]